MSNSSSSQQSSSSGLKLALALAPLTLGVALLTSTQMPAEAIPAVIQSPLPTTHIYGSPIPSPVPVVPGTSYPYSISPRNSRDYNPIRTRRPVRGVIQDSTLINPTIINSTISDSVLVDPVIINTPRSTRRTNTRPRIIYNSPGIYTAPGTITIRGY